MEAAAEGKKKSSNRILLLFIILILVVILAAAAIIMFGRTKEDDSRKIGYSGDAVVVLDEDSLQAALDEASKNAIDGNVALWYQNNGYSVDGTHFTCFVGNSKANLYDCFLTIFADAELTDQLYLSGLVPPGSGFEELTLDHALDKGDHTVYVVVTLVDEEDGEQVMKGQVVHTMEFHVESIAELQQP